jgi:hypothetical protein
MPQCRAFYGPFLLLLIAVLCAAGVWTYANRVLIPYQTADALLQDRPRGNLSDLYPRWLGARELLLHGRDPYSPAVSREIQQGYYGRALDPTRPGDPKDQQGFAYPVYVAFILAPTIHLRFEIVQKGFFYVLLGLTLASIPLWLRALRWPAPWWVQAGFIVFTLGSLPVMQGLKLQQITLLVAALIAIAVVLLMSDHMVAAGVVLALATIKPQLVWLLLLWLMIWTWGDWRSRYRWAASFLATMTVLVAASEWFLPHWIPRFWQAFRDYESYTAGISVMHELIGTPWSSALEVLALAAVLQKCWKERRPAANTRTFSSITALTLAATLLLVPTYAPYNQVLLIPAVLLLLHERRLIWRRGPADRVLFLTAATLIFWPWISSVALGGLSFLLPLETVERGWAIPLWTALQIPLGVASLTLLHCYRGFFTVPAEPRTS